MKKIVEVHTQNKILSSSLKAVYCDSVFMPAEGIDVSKIAASR